MHADLGRCQMKRNNAQLFSLKATTSIIDGQSCFSPDIFSNLIEQQCDRLRAMNVRKGDRVVIYGPKTVSYCALLLALFSIGAIAVPVFSGLKTAQLQHIFTDCSPTAAFASKFMLQQLRNTIGSEKVRLEEIGCNGDIHRLDFNCDTDVSSDDDAAIIYTSGSTGQPKGVVFSRSNLLLGARSVAQYSNLNSGDCVLCVLPFSFDAGLVSFLSALVSGAKIVLVDFVQTSQLLVICKRWGVTTMTAVPGFWNKIAYTDWSAANSTITRLCSTGGHLSPTLHQKLQSTFPNANIYPMYGFTEAFRCTYIHPSAPC
jgi:acyl-CoA synthetase (AMP-forming)/AMP-acid ligase II